MQVNVQLTQGPIPVHFTIIKHSNQLTLGVSVSDDYSLYLALDLTLLLFVSQVEAEIDGNSSTTLIPYYEIPLNISLCPGGKLKGGRGERDPEKGVKPSELALKETFDPD